ncbi:MAG: cytochrome c [Betaproteobacteria bacterium]|nr:cytochrome c [Betaproteobacteria bacterium]
MSRAWVGALGTVAVLGGAAAVVVASGVVDVSADTPHSPAVYRLLEIARERSIARRLADISVPGDLDTAERLRRGAGNYAAMCASCHLAPGSGESEIRAGLYPKPPDLTRPVGNGVGGREAARRFWIIKHGIKSSAMAAWSRGGMSDQDIWDLVAFLDRLPGLSKDQYHDLVEASPGHHHGGHEAGAPEDDPPGHHHDDEAHSHART